MQKKPKIGFVGLGSMGLPMAGHLVAAGYDVTGCDIRPDPIQALKAKGGHGAATPRDCAKGADVLILMVVNAAQARAALYDGQALEAMKEGAIVALMSTCPPDDVETLAAEIAKTGRVLIDAPVSGGVVGAEAGTLSIMCAGDPAVLARLNEVFDVIGGKTYVVGTKPGQGAVAKAINQLLCGVHIAAAAEALALAEQLEIDTSVMLEIVSGSAASSWMLRDRGPRMIAPPGPITSAVDIFVKDLWIVAETGRAAKAPLPLAAAALQMFLAASSAGEGGLDDSQVIAAYRRLSGKTPTSRKS